MIDVTGLGLYLDTLACSATFGRVGDALLKKFFISQQIVPNGSLGTLG